MVTANGTMGAAVLRADFDHDALGRVTSQTDYAQDGTVSYSRTGIAYDGAGRVTHETSTSRQGASTLVTPTAYGYGWHGGAVQSSIAYTPDTANASTVYTTGFALTPSGQVSGATIADGRPRSVAFTLDAYGRAVRRDEADNNPSGDPHQLWYRFNGREMGTIGNEAAAVFRRADHRHPKRGRSDALFRHAFLLAWPSVPAHCWQSSRSPIDASILKRSTAWRSGS